MFNINLDQNKNAYIYEHIHKKRKCNIFSNTNVIIVITQLGQVIIVYIYIERAF